MDRSPGKCIFKSCVFISIISALTLFSPPSIYAADVTLAWCSNSEPDLAGYFIYYKTGASGAPYNGTGAVEGNSPIQVPVEKLNDSAPEYTIHGLSDTETTYFVLTAYDTDDNESGYSNEVSYHPPSGATLSSLSVGGNDSLNENTSTGYTATATFSDGSTQTVTDAAEWTEDSGFASITGSGVLTASEVLYDETVTIQASYTFGGVTRTAAKTIAILDVPPSNLPPSTPVIVYPETGQDDIDVPLDITTQPFSDPNLDSHGQSRWQISDQSDFSSLVVDVTSNAYLTTFSVPHMVLKSNHKYYVRVRFYDTYSVASDWCPSVEFTTALFFQDLNLNGVPDNFEVDDSVDFNMDGIPDNHQPETIKCVQSSDNSMYIGIEKISDTISEIEAVEMIDPETIPDTANQPDDLIFGLILYRLKMKEPGGTATLKIYFSGEIFESDTFFKYDTLNGWYDYSEHTTFNDDGQSVTLNLVDGGYGDSDGLANGIIVDPGGIAASGIYDSNSGGSSGCFIATAAFGSKFEKNVRLLRRFRDLYLMPFKIGRAFVKTYYRYSPPVAEFIANHDILRAVVRWGLIPLIGLSWMLLHIGAAPTLIFLILTSSTLLFYFRKAQKKFCRNHAILIKKPGIT
jgi:hypothetical protein